MTNPFPLDLADYPTLFVRPAVTGEEPRLIAEGQLIAEFAAECERVREAKAGEYLYFPVEEDALNELRHRYSGVDEAKAMVFCSGRLEHSFMDEYTLDILADWKLQNHPVEGARTLLRCASRHANLFYVRAACLLRVGSLCEGRGLQGEASQFYEAVLASTGQETMGRLFTDSRFGGAQTYLDAAQAGLERLDAAKLYAAQQEQREAQRQHLAATLPERRDAGFNPISRAQEITLRLDMVEHGLSQEGDRIVALAQNGIGFRDAPGREDVIGGTRFGGLPDVPPGWTWPHPEYEFLAQINLAEVAPHDFNGVLPRTGLLSVFALGLGFGGLEYATLFYDGDFALLQRAAMPEGFEVFDPEENVCLDLTVYGALSVEPFNFVSLPQPGIQWSLSEEQQSEGDELYKREQYLDELWEQMQGMLPFPIHPTWESYLLGHGAQDDQARHDLWRHRNVALDGTLHWREEARRVQQDMADWVLLLKIDSNDGIGMGFNDAGQLYFYIHRDDLAARRFDRLYYTMTSG